jgi:hypothetical protein
MNSAALVLRISKIIERFPHFHKIARRAYCVFRPGIRFQTEAAFKDYQDIFVLKIGANDGTTSDPLATLLLTDARYRGLLVEPIPMYAAMLRNYGKCDRFAIEQGCSSCLFADGKYVLRGRRRFKRDRNWQSGLGARRRQLGPASRTQTS